MARGGWGKQGDHTPTTSAQRRNFAARLQSVGRKVKNVTWQNRWEWDREVRGGEGRTNPEEREWIMKRQTGASTETWLFLVFFLVFFFFVESGQMRLLPITASIYRMQKCWLAQRQMSPPLCFVYSRRNNRRCAPGARAATININRQLGGELEFLVLQLVVGSDIKIIRTINCNTKGLKSYQNFPNYMMLKYYFFHFYDHR